MSGGYFDYKEYAIERMADDIDYLIRINEIDDEANGCVGNRYTQETIAEFSAAVELLRKAFVYVHQIDSLVSGDTGEESFAEYLKQDLEKLK